MPPSRDAAQPVLRRLACRRGVTALEYGLIAGVVTAALVVGAGRLGSNMNTDFAKGAAFIAYIDK